MAMAMHPPDQSTSRAALRPQRVLACVLCQQRKIKCDRKLPCANCVKACAKCVPATQAPRQRRRRYGERELLDRLRYYEGLLRQNNIDFEPLHTPANDKTSPSDEAQSNDSPGDTPSERRESSTSIKNESEFRPRNLFEAMNQADDAEDDNDADSDSGFQDGVRKDVIKKTWDRICGPSDLLLFGARDANVDLSILHPEQVQIFRLWQIYQENVNPLLKVTHIPTLQTRLLDAAANVADISAPLQALMFGIYCVSVYSLTEDDCGTLFGKPKEDLMITYRFGFQQALLKSDFLRSSNRDCLIALFLYLTSLGIESDPRSMSAVLGIAMRMAQRMGLSSETANAKYTTLEAEMRRRLWWALVIFDGRIAEMSDSKCTMLNPIWDCGVPVNVNDLDIRPEMKSLPATYEGPTDTLFVVVRSEMADFIRHCTFHLDFSNPALKAVAKSTRNGAMDGCDLMAWGRTIENKYLISCNPENPLHFMTIWTARGVVAKCRLWDYYATCSPSQQTDQQRDTATSYALTMLECDNKLMNSPLTKGYYWFNQRNFPFPAFIHIIQDLRKRPTFKAADKAWETMSDNYEARSMGIQKDDNPLFKSFVRIVLQAWEAREGVPRPQGSPLIPPRIVEAVKVKAAKFASNTAKSSTEPYHGAYSMTMDDFQMPTPFNYDGNGVSSSLSETLGLGPTTYTSMQDQTAMDLDMNHFDWNSIDWNTMPVRGY